jgi:hypothetical protein
MMTFRRSQGHIYATTGDGKFVIDEAGENDACSHSPDGRSVNRRFRDKKVIRKFGRIACLGRRCAGHHRERQQCQQDLGQKKIISTVIGLGLKSSPGHK